MFMPLRAKHGFPRYRDSLIADRAITCLLLMDHNIVLALEVVSNGWCRTLCYA